MNVVTAAWKTQPLLVTQEPQMKTVNSHSIQTIKIKSQTHTHKLKLLLLSAWPSLPEEGKKQRSLAKQSE